MLKKYSIVILLFLVSACSNPQVKKQAETKELVELELQLAESWQLSYFDEPIFKSKMAVLEAGNKNQPPIILIHGLGELGMKDWFSVIPTLEKNYHVIALDLPGFGLSTDAKGRFLPSNYAQVIAAVSEKYTNQKPIVIGHSMGGAVALRYTELYPQSVKQLILVDAAGLLEKSAFIKHIATFEFGDDWPIFVQRQIKKLNRFGSRMVEKTTKSNAIANFLQKNDYAWNWLVSGSSNMNAGLSLVEEDFSQTIKEVSVPVDIIWGEKDNVAPLRTGKVLSKQMINARLQVIKGAGHVPMNDSNSLFVEALHIALNEPTINKNTLLDNGKSQGKLMCQKQRDQIYTGHYDEITIENCDNIQLINISTDRLSIKGSVVDIENLYFSNKENQLTFTKSVVTITNADLSGHNIMFINGSRIDMAGVSIKATGDALMIGNSSRISASFSDISSPNYTGALHGLFYLSNTTFTGK